MQLPPPTYCVWRGSLFVAAESSSCPLLKEVWRGGGTAGSRGVLTHTGNMALTRDHCLREGGTTLSRGGNKRKPLPGSHQRGPGSGQTQTQCRGATSRGCPAKQPWGRTDPLGAPTSGPHARGKEPEQLHRSTHRGLGTQETEGPPVRELILRGAGVRGLRECDREWGFLLHSSAVEAWDMNTCTHELCM